ncbi:MAG: antibiotic biosynthesis monooxygenase [Simkania sp.]|nr:antibiotic biosynthesis monooxygenase [Simkania sp.]
MQSRYTNARGEEHSSPTILCLSYFQAKPQYRDVLILELLKLVESTRAERGCIYYELFLDNEDPNFLIVAEKFVNQQALDDHEKKPYIVSFVEGPMDEYCKKVTWHVARELKKL